MDIEMVLNELSFQQPAPDVATAQDWMATLLLTASAAGRLGVQRALRTDRHMNSIEIASDYRIAQWLNDGRVDKDLRRTYLGLASKTPFLTEDDAAELHHQMGISEFRRVVPGGEAPDQGDVATGLGIAFLLDGLALSFNSRLEWDAAVLRLEFTWLNLADELDHDSFEEYGSRVVLVAHASRREHVVQHRTWITDRTKAGVRDGADVWARRAALFPSLQFCDALEDQVTGLGAGHRMLRPVVKRLFELEHYCRGWTGGPFDPAMLPSEATTESAVTLQQYGAERTFLCPNGEERLFDWHVRLTPDPWRIHFFPLPETRQIIVGYAGRHLRTVKYST